ncbi:hypothetical protein CO612_00555 [Lysobacteraceae bacterium NML71-0210]|nr:hypothetical protein CO612_00555 [Xanthomonadaceae bacterium NML71-0210]
MSITRYLALAALLTALPLTAQNKPAERKLYCWDEGGRKVCGDALPASAVNSARTEISSRTGMPAARLGRMLSPSEQAEAAAQEAARRQEAERIAAQKRSDTALAESYDSEDALRHAFKVRYELVDESLKTSEMTISTQRKSLLQLMHTAADLELEGKPVNEKLSQDIQAQRAALVDAMQMQQQQQTERHLLDSQQQEALARWRKARGIEAAVTE